MILSSPLWCLLCVLAILPWCGRWLGLGDQVSTVQKIFRSLLFLVLGLALARPQWIVQDQIDHRVLLVDTSKSVDDEIVEKLLGRAVGFASADKSAQHHLVVVGKALSEVDRKQLNDFQSVLQIASDDRRGDSPLSAGLALASTVIPRNGSGSVTVVTDGLATRPSDDRGIVSLKDKEVPVHVVEVPINSASTTLVSFHWSQPLRKGKTSRLHVDLAQGKPGDSGSVILLRNEQTIASSSFLRTEAEVDTVTLEFEPEQAGFFEGVLAVDIEGESRRRAIDVVLPIHEPHQLLYLGDLQTGGRKKVAAMLGSGFDVVTADPSDQTELTTALQKSDVILMDDMVADSLPIESEERITRAVQNDGLGLVMSGGRASFGAGGWHDRPIESMLPVEFVQKEEKRDPSTSLVVVIDTSGSMSGVRVQLAKEVARLAMRRLLPHDKVGIVEFYGAKRWAAPLQPASNAIELQRALNRMDAGGGTVILPALEEAFYGLQNVDTRYKHVLVLTDGGVESGDFESLMRRMANEGINVSTVLAGGGYHSEFLVNIANWGKGRFYNVPNRFNLPEILLKQPSTTKLPSYRPGVHSVRARGGRGWWGEIDMANIPALAGYVESKPRIGSEVLMETVEEKHPILSTWRYGLGRVTTLLTEPVGEGTEPWKQWSDYSTALSRILQRTAADGRDPFRYHVENDGGEMLIHAIRNHPRRDLHVDALPAARLSKSDGQSEGSELVFKARSPDRFVARMPVPPRGTAIKVRTSASSTPLRSQPFVVASPVANEDAVDPRTKIDLSKLANLTGGQSLEFDSDWSGTSVSKSDGKQFWSISSWLFSLALILFLAEIIWRRLPRRKRIVS